jgi:hypothetical protein
MADDSAEIRAWAAANGLDVAQQGRLPGSVVEAYRAAVRADQADQGGGGEPDWTGAELAADDDDPPGATPTPGPGPGAAASTPPPPADLDEARDRIARESKPRKGGPRWAAGGGRKRSRPAKPQPVTKAVQQDIEGKLALLLAAPVNLWAAVDPACGSAAVENYEQTIRAAVPLICQSPAAVRMFTEGTTWMLWAQLVTALQPVGLAVWRHHVTGTVTVVNGRVVPSRRLPDGRVVPADSPEARQAAEAERPDYSAYTTQVFGHVPDVRPA